jgi:PRC-barrel domain
MKRLHRALVAAFLLTAIPALAQTDTTQPANKTDQTQTTVPDTTSSTTKTDQNATTATQTNQMATGDMWYATQNNEMRASKLIGTSVYSTSNERIGEINEILLDNSGKVRHHWRRRIPGIGRARCRRQFQQHQDESRCEWQSRAHGQHHQGSFEVCSCLDLAQIVSLIFFCVLSRAPIIIGALTHFRQSNCGKGPEPIGRCRVSLAS